MATAALGVADGVDVLVGVTVRVALIECEGVTDFVTDDAGVSVGCDVREGVIEGVTDLLTVCEGVTVLVGVSEIVGVTVGVLVGVAVAI